MNYLDSANIAYFFWFAMAWIFPTVAFVYGAILLFKRVLGWGGVG